MQTTLIRRMRASRLGQLGVAVVQSTAPVLRARWFGYAFGLSAVLVLTAPMAVLMPARVSNASALYAIPVLLTAALYGRTPGLTTSIAASAGVAAQRGYARHGN